MDKKIIEDKLNSALQPIHMVVNDVSDGCGLKYNLLIVSETFKDKSILDCHRQSVVFYNLSRPFYEKKCRLFMLFLFLLLPQTNGIIGDEKFCRMLIDEEMHSSSEDGWNAFEQHHDMSWITIC
ncbi:hypothetical protein T01_10555 [Trichinella spiralis]|uniref:BolA-like protein 3 n=1 Tax=Trichinella spiralis TaxID=6334 RepID=A0A0V1BXH2_TRISP|nr:hypothetical protein T01_10555 [Trichinella spiralis]